MIKYLWFLFDIYIFFFHISVMTLIGVKILNGFCLVTNIEACGNFTFFFATKQNTFFVSWSGKFYASRIPLIECYHHALFCLINQNDLINLIEKIFQLRHIWFRRGIEWWKLMGTYCSALFHWTVIQKNKSLNLKFSTDLFPHAFQQREPQINQSFQGGSSSWLQNNWSSHQAH